MNRAGGEKKKSKKGPVIVCAQGRLPLNGASRGTSGRNEKKRARISQDDTEPSGNLEQEAITRGDLGEGERIGEGALAKTKLALGKGRLGGGDSTKTRTSEGKLLYFESNGSRSSRKSRELFDERTNG